MSIVIRKVRCQGCWRDAFEERRFDRLREVRLNAEKILQIESIVFYVFDLVSYIIFQLYWIVFKTGLYEVRLNAEVKEGNCRNSY
ncbi:hypothetical protein CH380_10080 [Leptospira adleri]|uniref:Uncharacterized protein n=1 Tax=Leptospira adleri TaxID=2023186 RepID=A0A2M9YPQ2_9LEPT|nr:hypothetical protein CH380_10080 [Leptospira adleri]PJZ62229.1 hypothetical protein CH376_09150 [Leptospira adleri]